MAGLRALTCLALAGLVQAAQYRGRGPNVTLSLMNASEVRNTMLSELMSALGDGNRVTQKRLSDIEEALKPMFAALPKNEEGRLDHGAARYALHRLFVQRHGMFIKGLEPGGKGWSKAAPPAELLDDLVPKYVQHLFEERLGSSGLGVHELSVLAATLEHLIHDEAQLRLRAAYRAHAVPLDAPVPLPKAEALVDTYMVLFLQGLRPEESTPENILAKQKDIDEVFPSWPQSKRFTRSVQRAVLAERGSEPAFKENLLSFEGTSAVVEEVMERYGRWQDGECRELKAGLVKMEAPGGPGRVPLKNFYNEALSGNWYFTESREYLRDLGALDESNPASVGVLIPNYVNSHSNCMASSSLFSVCCLDECEPLLGQLEQALAAPEAEPERILELVEALPSSSVQAPRQLSQELKDKLAEVAQEHGGRVPLHGRLFGQWLHHAYPRECPYPHKAGTTNPLTADEWLGENASRLHQASYEEMQRLEQEESKARSSGAVSAEAKMMWSKDEELVAEHRQGENWLLRRVAMLGALLALTTSLFRGLSAMGAFRPAKGKQGLPMVVGKSHYC